MKNKQRIGLSLAILFAAIIGFVAVNRAAEPSATKNKESSKTKKSASKTSEPPKQAAPKIGTRFMRVTRDKQDRPLAMQTAIKRYVPVDTTKSGPVVDLIAAVHIADASYYRQLNEEFKNYDALLFELVAPHNISKKKISKKGHGRTNMLSSLQIWMKDMLSLEFQLEKIDYDRKNFVHADMSPSEFSKSMRDRGETPLKMFLKLMKASASQQASGNMKQPDLALILRAMFDKERGPIILKQIVADQLGEMDVLLEAFNGKEGSTLVTERNKVALKVLRKQIGEGKKRIGIFYGSAHMPDFEERLVSEFGMKLKNQRWLTAWDLKDDHRAASRKRSMRRKSKRRPKPSNTKKLKLLRPSRRNP